MNRAEPHDAGRVLIKVCGFTTPDAAVAAAASGVDWFGLNFHRPSPRYVAPDVAASIVQALPAEAVAVGLFVDRPPAEVVEIAERVGLGTVQLHGDEPPGSLDALGPLKVVKAFRIGSPESLARMLAWLDRAEALGRPPDAVLVDADVPGLPGGTGRTIECALLDDLPPLSRLILAGGLSPANVADRVARFRPWMVDVAGGVESSPGLKDLALVAAFVRAARGVAGR